MGWGPMWGKWQQHAQNPFWIITAAVALEIKHSITRPTNCFSAHCSPKQGGQHHQQKQPHYGPHIAQLAQLRQQPMPPIIAAARSPSYTSLGPSDHPVGTSAGNFKCPAVSRCRQSAQSVGPCELGRLWNAHSFAAAPIGCRWHEWQDTMLEQFYQHCYPIVAQCSATHSADAITVV